MGGMNVLVVEHELGDADHDGEVLARDGNYVFHCFPERWGRDQRQNPFLCIGVSDGACPLDAGIDVAMVRKTGEFPSIFTAGSLCALRRGIPLAQLDQTMEVVSGCESAIEASYDELRMQIRWRLVPILSELGLRHDALTVRFEPLGPELRITITGPPLARSVKARIAIRTTDAIRSTQRTYSKQSVIYEDS